MSDPQYEIRLWMQSELEVRGHGAKRELADFLNLRPDAITRMMNTDPDKETREIRGHELVKMESFFGSRPASARQRERLIPIVGKAGAGPDGSVLFAEADGNFGEVPAPEGSSSGAVALEVEGNSMRGMAEDGWLIFYEDQESPREDHMGEPCVCWLEDGRVLVKTPYPGRARGLFNLESVNAPLMRDVPVRYFAFVTDIKPRKAAQKFIRRNPKRDIRDVKLAG